MWFETTHSVAANSAATEGKEEDGDDHFNIVSGDLGLGDSTGTCSYINSELLNLGHGHNFLSASDSCLHTHVGGLINSSSLQGNTLSNECCASLFGKKSMYSDKSCDKLMSQDTPLETSRSSVSTGDSRQDLEDFPTYADVPYGTSLRQQKKLFEQQIDNLRRQFSASLPGNSTESSKKFNWASLHSVSQKLTAKEIESKLIVALQEMDELKIELDVCQKRLDAKYKAVAILKEQADLAGMELKKTERKASEISKNLEQHGDGMTALGEALDDKADGHTSEDTDNLAVARVCQENAMLMSKLEGRNEELRRANAHKSAISRERDELLALLDVTERLKYEQGKSRVAEDEYSTFTSSELAVLGACKCRISSPEPCGCAHAAANLRKEVAKLREELEQNQKRREESNLTVDAYRLAFEEQLAKNRKMSIQLSQIATLSSRTSKAKAALKWLVQVLNDDDYIPPKPTEQGMEAEKGNTLSNMSLQELVTVLTEMVHEKNEALAHQKLAAQVLHNKLYMFEKLEGSRSDGTETGAASRIHKHKKKRNRVIHNSQDGGYSQNANAVNRERNSGSVSCNKHTGSDDISSYQIHQSMDYFSDSVNTEEDSHDTSVDKLNLPRISSEIE